MKVASEILSSLQEAFGVGQIRVDPILDAYGGPGLRWESDYKPNKNEKLILRLNKTLPDARANKIDYFLHDLYGSYRMAFRSESTTGKDEKAVYKKNQREFVRIVRLVDRTANKNEKDVTGAIERVLSKEGFNFVS